MTIANDLAVFSGSAGGVNTAGFMRNRIINGNMNIWQRGTSFTGSGTTTYTADRWCNIQYAGSTATISRVSSGLTGVTYAIRIQRPNGTTNTQTPNIAQCIESQNCLDMAGQTITLSFYARVGSNFSATSSVLVSGIAIGTGTDQNVYTTGYTSQTTYTQNNTASTSWQRFTHTVTIASNVTEISVYFYYIPTGTAGANDYYDLSFVQLEIGSTATPFEYEPVSQTLIKCQRYFEKNFPINVAPAHNTGGFIPIPNAGSFGCGGNQYATVSFRVTKRTTPTGRYYDPSGAASASTNAFRYTTACNSGLQSTVTSFDTLSTECMGGYFQAVTDASIQFFWTADAEI
jgi:hypothetical protein